MRPLALPFAVVLCLATSVGFASAAPKEKATAGAAGLGDPYYPLDGNGGYNVQHYDLDLSYEPDTDVLTGVATITATATQALSRYDLDFDGLTVRAITVNGSPAKWHRSRGELVITPSADIANGSTITTVVTYDGIPGLIPEGETGGWVPTDDGVIMAGEPHGAATWFPANDHPTDKASFTIHMNVPAGLEAVGNGRLVGSVTAGGRTTWTWDAVEPMATYLATINVGDFDINAYSADGIDFWDAIDPDLFEPVAAPRTGTQFAISQAADSSYKRLMRAISVPAEGADLTFWVDRNTENPWDFVFVEAHTLGQDDWTTLPDANGHSSQDTGFSCPGWHNIHPFLTHYQSNGCKPSGSTGDWWAATGTSGDPEEWTVDLGAFAGSDVEVSISYASDESVQGPGLFVDDIMVSTGEGSTSFENDGDTMDGWTVPGAPEGSPGNDTDWTVGTAADVPPAPGAIAAETMAREPEILAFESSRFGSYPFSTSGGLVDDIANLGFSLETQTRPIYPGDNLGDANSAAGLFVHELSHQWFGDNLSVAEWKNIWLNEGFATYAEWLWSEDQNLGTAQEIFDFFYDVIPAEDSFWSVVVADPGAGNEFNGAEYVRGGMTLHALRVAVGDDDFFEILQTWVTDNAGGNVTTQQFMDLAESISGQQLDDLFNTWLFTPAKPALSTATARAGAAATSAPSAAKSELSRYLAGSTFSRP